jgi:predicted MFS family arabinose efflux permease
VSVDTRTGRRGDAREQGPPFSWRFLAPLFIGSALNPVNSSLIATALAPIAAAMHIGVGRTSILVAVLYLASAVAQPALGKLGQQFGPRRIFLVGIAFVFLGGLAGALGSTMAGLIVARVLIGIGTSAGYPTAIMMIRRRAEDAGLTVPPGGVLGGLSIAGQATAALGLPLGGVLVSAFGWRSTFLINLPVAVIAFVLAWLWTPRDPARSRSSARELLIELDPLGVLAFAGTVISLLVFLLGLPATIWASLIAFLAMAALLVRWELRAPVPFIDLRMLTHNRALTLTYLRVALTFLCVYGALYGLTQWLQGGRGLDAMQTGLLMLPMTGLAALISTPVSRRNLVRSPLRIGAATMLLAAVILLFTGSGSPLVLIIIVTLLFGITLGTGSVSNQAALYSQSPADQIGTASGLLRTFTYLGAIGSSVVTGLVFRANAGDTGLHTMAVILAIVAAATMALLAFDRTLPRHA